MAEQGGESAFEILGRVEVDLNTLKKSLSAAEGEVRAHGERLQRIWTDTSKKAGQVIFNEGRLPGDKPGGGGEGVGGGGGEGGGRSGAAQFAHMARAIRHTLIPALMQLNPEMGHFISAGAASARTAVFFGGAIAGVAVAAAVLSAVLGAYLKAAKEATAATFEAGQSLKTWDSARVEAGLKKVSEAVSEYVLQQDIASGKVEAGFWQKVIAWSTIASEAVTKSIDVQIKKYLELLEASIKIGKAFTLPAAEIKARKDAAELMGQQAEMAIRNAKSVEDVSKAYDKKAASIEAVNKADADKVKLDIQKQEAGVRDDAKEKADIVLKAAGARQDATLRGLAQQRITGGLPRELIERKEAAARREYMEAVNTYNRLIILSDENARIASTDNVNQLNTIDKKKTQQLLENKERERKAIAALEVVDREQYVQKEIARNQKRIEGEASMAEAIAQSEERVRQVQRERVGDVESEIALESRLGDTRQRAIAPLIASIDAVNKTYESQKRALEEQIEAGIDAAANSNKLADAERSRASEVLAINRKITQERSSQDAAAVVAREARVKREIELEERVLQHAVAMGRATMQDQMAAERAAMADPRRSVAQHEQAERNLFQLRRDYADQYFRYYNSLGASTWGVQIQVARSALSELAVGSKPWLDAVQKIADVYKQINDQAKGVFQQQLAISRESTAREAEGPRTSIAGISRDVSRQRSVDVGVLSRGRGTRAQIAGAINRQELFRTMDREGLTPDAAFARSMQDPQAQLAQALSQAGSKVSQYSAVTDASARSVYDLGVAASEAAAALRELAGGDDVLSSSGKKKNTTIDPAFSGAQGLNLQREARRGASATEPAL